MSAVVEMSRDVEESFGFADPDLADLCDRLTQEGADVPALLDELAKMDPDRLMRRYRAVALREQEIERRAAAEKAAVEMWREKHMARLSREKQFLGGQLIAAARTLAERTKGKVKRLETIWGYVQLRRVVPTVKTSLLEEALASLDAAGRPDLIRVKREPAIDLLKKAHGIELCQEGVKLDGKLLAGFEVTIPSEDRAVIYPNLPMPMKVVDNAAETE